jgi:hypothetical protein
VSTSHQEKMTAKRAEQMTRVGQTSTAAGRPGQPKWKPDPAYLIQQMRYATARISRRAAERAAKQQENIYE